MSEPPSEGCWAGQIRYDRDESSEASVITIIIPDAWLELQHREFTWRIEAGFQRVRNTFQMLYDRNSRKKQGEESPP